MKKFSYPHVTFTMGNIKFVEGEICQLPSEYTKVQGTEILDFYKEILEKSKSENEYGTDPLKFDYIKIGIYVFVGLIFIPERSSRKNKNKKKYPNNVFRKDYILQRAAADISLNDLTKYIPIEIFTQSLHELRGLNSKISGEVENLIGITDEITWGDRFDDASPELKKIFVGSRLTKFILDNTRFYNPEFVERLTIKEELSFFIHKSIYKLVKIYDNGFEANRTEVSFTGNTMRKLKGQREYFEIILKTIIENAIKYSIDRRIGPKVTVENLGTKKVSIEVQSFGKGIPEEEIPYLFDRGFRSSSHNNYKGSGMGLYIAKSLCDLYNISISYTCKKPEKITSYEAHWNVFTLICNDTFENEKLA